MDSADRVLIRGSNASAVRRNPVFVGVMCVLTLGLYMIYWWYQLTRELRDLGRANDVDLGREPAKSALAVSLGWLLFVPPLLSVYRTGQRLQHAERLTGRSPSSLWPLIGLLIAAYLFLILYGLGLIFASLFAYAMQLRLNRIWDSPLAGALALAPTDQAPVTLADPEPQITSEGKGELLRSQPPLAGSAASQLSVSDREKSASDQHRQVAGLFRWGHGRRPPEYKPPTFRIVALGASGSGKTVFLSSLFHELNYLKPGRSYYLDIMDAQQRIALGSIYGQVSDTSRDWPSATRTGETREFLFDCIAVDEEDGRHTLLHMSYLDYAGELLEVEQEPGSGALMDLDRRIKGAHALVAMIDGYRVRQLLRGERVGRDYFQRKLRPMFGFIQSARCPIHLVITKWDLVRDFGEPQDADDQLRLDRVIEALLRYEYIKALVYVHSRRQVVRLIPVSAVGQNFAQLNAEGYVSKLPDGELRPMNVVVPLCAVLPDLFTQVERSLDDAAQRELQSALRRRLRSDMVAIVAQLLRRAAGQILLPPLGADAAELLAGMLAPPRARKGEPPAKSEIATRQRMSGIVMDDFKRTVLKLEALLPQSELSSRW